MRRKANQRLAADSFLGRGWTFPVRPDARTGRIKLVSHAEDIKQSILIILKTRKGERVMRPDFGCGINDLVFASMDANTLGLIKDTVEEALARFEPRIDVLRVEVSRDAAANGQLLVSIDYRVRETNNEANVVYPFYLRGP